MARIPNKVLVFLKSSYLLQNTLFWMTGTTILRATDCNFVELADKSEIADFFIFCQEKPFSELLLKTAFKLLKEFSFLRYPAKCEKPGLGPGRPENAPENRACWRLPGSKLKHRIAIIFVRQYLFIFRTRKCKNCTKINNFKRRIPSTKVATSTVLTLT